MPGEPIDEYSIKLNADVENLITDTQDAMSQIEGMMDDLAKKGKELGEIEPERLIAAFDKIAEVFGETEESAASAELAILELEAAGVKGEAAYVVFAEALDKVKIKTEELSGVGEDAGEKFELQDIMLRKVNQNLQIMSKEFQEAGKAIPIEKLKALERQLVAIFQTGVLEQRLPLDEVFKRMDEKTVEAMRSLKRLNQEAGKTQSAFGGIVQRIGGAFGINTQKMMGQVQGLLKGGAELASKFGLELGAISTVAVAVAAAFVALGVAFFAVMKLAKEGIAIALRNAEVHERFSLVIRQQQRALGDLAFSQREANEAAAELAENYGLAREEAESLLSTAMFLTREFKLTAEETLNLADAAAVLGKQAGRSAESALRSVTQFMLTGYTQGLQQLGITIRDGEIELRAYNKGLIRFGDEIDEATRAAVAMEIIMEKAEEGRQDAIESTREWANAIEVARNEASEAKEDFGSLFLGIAAKFEEIKTTVLVVFLDILTRIMLSAAGAVIIVGAFIKTIEEMGDLLDERGRLRPDAKDSGADELFGKRLEKNLEEAGEGFQTFIDKVKRLGEDTESAAGGIGETFEGFSLRVANASLKIMKELDKLQQKFDESMARIAQRLADTLAKIDVDFGRRRKDAALNLTRDMRDIDEGAQEDVIDATVDHQEELFRLEEDHKLKMQRLEEAFLFDLEDAVRERDARGVLMAIRRFNQQKKEMEQDKNIRTRRLQEDFKNELKEIELERRRRRAERMLEFGEQQDDLAEQEARRREDALAAQARAERDLHAANERKLKILGEGFLAEFMQANFSLNEIFELMRDYLGEGGFVDQLYDYIAGRAASLNLVPNVSLSSQTSTDTADYGGPGGLGHQRGGTLFATSPTMAVFGEGGPERVDFTPLSAGTGLPKAGFEGGAAGGGATDINLEVMLEDGLEAHLVDQAMDGVANVLLSIGRKAKR